MAMKKETIKIILEVLQDKIAMMETSVNLGEHKDDLSVISAFNHKPATPSTLLEQLENVPEAFRSVIMTRMDSVVQNIKKTQIYYDALDDILANTGDDASATPTVEEPDLPHLSQVRFKLLEEPKPVETPKAAETPKPAAEAKPAEAPAPIEKPIAASDVQKYDSKLSRDAKPAFVNHYSAELERKYVGLLFDKDGYLRFQGVDPKRYFKDEKTDSLRDTVTSKRLSICRVIGGNSFYYWRFGGIIVPVPTTMWISAGKAEIDHLKKTGEYYRMASAMCEKLPEIIKQLEAIVEAEKKAAAEVTAKKAPAKAVKPAAAPTESKAVKPTTTPNVEETFQLPLPTANADERQIPLDWDSSVPKDRYYVSSLGYVYDMIAKKKLVGEQIRLLTNSGKGKTINLKKIVYNAFNPSSRMCGYLRIFTRDGNEANCAISNLYIARGK